MEISFLLLLYFWVCAAYLIIIISSTTWFFFKLTNGTKVMQLYLLNFCGNPAVSVIKLNNIKWHWIAKCKLFLFFAFLFIYNSLKSIWYWPFWHYRQIYQSITTHRIISMSLLRSIHTSSLLNHVNVSQYSHLTVFTKAKSPHFSCSY